MTTEENAAGIAAARRGERVAGPNSLHACEKPSEVIRDCVHNWRTLFCDNETDVIECSRCGKQALAKCDFDEEYA